MAKAKFIRDNRTGEIRFSRWQDGSRFWWEDGNAACDCNRVIAFGDDDGSEDFPCSDDRYDLVNEDGTPYDDWPKEED